MCTGKGGVETLSEKTMPEPELREYDLLVEVKAAAVNPVDGKNRSHNMAGGDEKILGYDGAGVVKQVGAKVDAQRFAIGAEVYFAGDLTRNGSNAEFIAIDSRIVGLKPKSLSFAEAAAVPLVALTVWEPLFESLRLATDGSDGKGKSILIVNGAGGVGSAAIQIAKLVGGFENVVATASRPETEEWVKSLGATHVINHRKDLAEELKRVGVNSVDVSFCCVDLELHYDKLVEVTNMGGSIISITFGDPTKIDVSKLFFPKRLTLSFEIMFGRIILGVEPERQGAVLDNVAKLIDEGKFKSIANKTFNGLSVENVKAAQELQDSGKAIGKIVIDYTK